MSKTSHVAPKSVPSSAYPGLFLGSASVYAPGAGTHTLKTDNGPAIYASITGPVVIDYSTTPQTLHIPRSQAALTALTRPQVNSSTNAAASTNQKAGANGTSNTTGVPDTEAAKAQHVLRTKNNTLPTTNSIILGRITRVQQKQAYLDILVVDGSPAIPLVSLKSLPAISSENTQTSLYFQGIIRKEDIRAVEKDKVVVSDMFRVGDIVRGTVVSLGDAGGAGGYYVSTARDELGVVMARGEGDGVEGKGGWMWPVNWKEMQGALGESEGRKVARPV